MAREHPGRCDVLVLGGGPAGLSAALTLARARRTVVVCDHGRPRNAASPGVHGYLTRDGIEPRDLVDFARQEVRNYGVVIHDVEVVRLEREDDGFVAHLRNETRLHARVALIATGVEDQLPPLEGLRELYGISIHHCPYCDGWEWRDGALVAYGRGRNGGELAHTLLSWSRDIVLCTDGPTRLTAAARQALERRGVRVHDQRIARLEGRDGRLEHVVFRNGERLERSAIFLATGNRQACSIATELGCSLTRKGAIRTGTDQCTEIPRLYAAGDATRDVQFVSVAAAEGVKAAVAIHSELQREERELELEGRATSSSSNGVGALGVTRSARRE